MPGAISRAAGGKASADSSALHHQAIVQAPPLDAVRSAGRSYHASLRSTRCQPRSLENSSCNLSLEIRRGLLHGSGLASEKQPTNIFPPGRISWRTPSRYVCCASSSRQCSKAESKTTSNPSKSRAHVCTRSADPRSVADASANATEPLACSTTLATSELAARSRAVVTALGLRSKPKILYPFIASQFALSPAPQPQSRIAVPFGPKAPSCAALRTGGCGLPQRSHGTPPSSYLSCSK
mmetsp:Transcript_147122/g.271487  ORF Transcript_147122/g.271487 Transcript_147122/m.271487 type:complete len:238 (+) Transcript_147122:599-1312(+)